MHLSADGQHDAGVLMQIALSARFLRHTRPGARLSARSLAVVTAVSRGFSQVLPGKCRMVPARVHDSFLLLNF
jgi:hypothetical protein